MPEIGRIQSTTFQALLDELGITRNQIPFVLQNQVLPVVLVGGTVSFIAAPTPPYGVTDIFTAGPQVAAPANTVLADTGQLPPGAYSLQFVWFTRELQTILFQWRNAANAANLFEQLFGVTLEKNWLRWESRFLVENANERFRILQGSNGGVGVTSHATILAKI